MSGAAAPGALDGMRVIDMTRQGPGPYCAMILGDFGAEVIRVEEPGGGHGATDARAAAFNAIHRNKRSVTLDMKTAGGREVLARLASGADVFIEGYRPGVTKRLGCDFEALAALNPRLVYCSISGYGQDGPYSRLGGHDLNYIAMTGALSLLAHPGGAPIVPPNVIADFAGGGMYAALGIVSALMARVRTGRGQYLDAALSDGVLYLHANIATRYFRDGYVPEPGNWLLNGGSPAYNVYVCRDGRHITICCVEPRFWAALCEAIGRPDLESVLGKPAEDARTRTALAETFRQKTRDEWWEILRPIGAMSAAPVLGLGEALQDPHHHARDMVVELGEVEGETVRQVGVGRMFSETPASVRRLAPLPGEHTDAVLGELGYGEAEIAALRGAGSFGSP